MEKILNVMMLMLVMTALNRLYAGDDNRIFFDPMDQQNYKAGGHPRQPSIQPFLNMDSEQKRAAVLICPGGGYTHLAYEKEGVELAKWFKKIGMQAFVLDYRYDDQDNGQRYHYPAPLNDAKMAMRLIRENAEKWHVDTGKVGVMGFSAGGHLASMLSTQFDDGNPEAEPEVLNYSCRPDFSVLVYPVITFSNEDYVHKGSRYHLLGDDFYDDQHLHHLLSSELQVEGNTPPAFLLHASDDKSVPVQNSLLYYQALLRNGVDAEIHVFEKGGHGFGMASGDKHLSNWTELLKSWLIQKKILK